MTGLTISQASRATGLSSAMIGYLCREGYVTPSLSRKSGRGRMRKFSYTDLLMMKTLSVLLNRGVEIRRIKNSLKVLREKYPALQPTNLPFRFLATDGEQVFEVLSDQLVLRLDNTSQYEFCFVIDLGPIEKEINHSLKRMGRAA